MDDELPGITDRIIADLEKGVQPWAKPWSTGDLDGRVARPHGVFYRGINTLMLWSEASGKGYGSASWMTFCQAVEFGQHVRKSEKLSLVVYANTISRTETSVRSELVEAPREMNPVPGLGQQHQIRRDQRPFVIGDIGRRGLANSPSKLSSPEKSVQNNLQRSPRARRPP